jgi:pilus assembly protein CpaC
MKLFRQVLVLGAGCASGLLVCSLLGVEPVRLAQAAPQAVVVTKGNASSAAGRSGSSRQQAAESAMPAEVGPAMSLTIGKSVLMRLPSPIERISLGNPAVADVTLISPREVYLLGKSFGSTNLILWRRNAPTTIIDIGVSMDAVALEERLKELLPAETGIMVKTAADAVVLTGSVSSALMADYAVSIAEAFARRFNQGLTLAITAGNAQVAEGTRITAGQAAQRGSGATGPRIINMMRIAQPQQVMLEVKVAEISKNLLDKLGVGIDAAKISGSWRYSILSNFLSGTSGVLGMLSNTGTGNALTLDAQKNDGLVRILAEPNIVSISGQEASFLAGGKIFLPVARSTGTLGLSTVSLEEKEFGVGLKFTPTVLDGGRINLKVAPEVSELSQTGSAFSTVAGQTTVLPSFTTRRAQTTVQLMDGQSFAVAGLIKNNVSEAIKRFPIIGEVPILGTLFRSSEFQTDRTELMFVVTARLVKPLPNGTPMLPTDSFKAPSREEFLLRGQLEGSGHPEVPLTDHQKAQAARQAQSAAPSAGHAAPPPASQPASSGGFQLK